MYNYETLKVAGYTKMKKLNKNEVLLYSPESGVELWGKSPHYAGYAVLIDGQTFEYIGSLSQSELDKKEWENV